MGLFFHDLDSHFSHFGTQCWNYERSISSASLLKGQFFEMGHSNQPRTNLQFLLTDEKIYLNRQQLVRSLDLCLTAMEERLYLQNGRKVYEIRLMKGDLLTTICTYNEKTFIDFYSLMARSCIMKNFEKHFRVSKQLGSGSFSVVYEGRSIYSNSEVALKVFDKKKLLQIQDGISILQNQIVNLEKLRRFNLSPLIQTYQTQDCIILVLKKAQCGHMIDYLKEHSEQYDQKMAQKIMKKIFENLNLLHTAGFIHRDIKPENILFDNHMNSFHLFLADFGLSVEKSTPKNAIGKKCSGTLGFVAPQVLHGNQYDQKCDIFSAGCLMFFLLTGKSLFQNMQIEDIVQVTYENDFIERKLNRLPQKLQQAKDLLKELLQVNSKKRISAQKALSHSFFSDHKKDETYLLSKFCGQDFDETIRLYIQNKINKFWK